MARGKWLLRAGGRGLGLWLALTGAGLAERLPIKVYTTADGLARDSITRIVRDSRGYLWFCTAEGLSRFDGYQFVNYTTYDGLPHRSVQDFLETRRGLYWVATAGGLCQFDPAAPAPRKFKTYHAGNDARPRAINVLYEDRAGTVWCGTENGLFRLEQSQGQWVLREVSLGQTRVYVAALLEDRRTNLWIGTGHGLFRLGSDGRSELYAQAHGLEIGADAVTALHEDRAGRLWLGMRFSGLYRLVADPRPDRSVVARHYTTKDRLPIDTILTLFEASDGHLWAGRGSGITEIIANGPNDDVTFRNYTTPHGLSDPTIGTLNEDRDGNLWLGSESGAMKIARNGFTTYAEADGLVLPLSGYLFTDQSGEVCGHFGTRKGMQLSRFNGQRFTSLWPPLPRLITTQFPGWGPNRVLQDRAGEWWLGTGRGLFRFPKTSAFERLAETSPKAVYTTKDGLIGDHIFTLHEDARGDLWIAIVLPSGGSGICCWDRTAGTIRCYSSAEGTDFLRENLPYIFGEDRTGQLWMGLYAGGLARYSQGRFTLFTSSDGVPAGSIRRVYCDQAGRLWVASGSGGVGRIDDPAAERPRWVTYTMAQGLSSNTINGIAEDRWGRIYLGTGRGVDRLDPASGRIKHFTTADGLLENIGGDVLADRQGALWFATRKGLARLVPEPERPAPPASVFIRGLRIAGQPESVSDFGETEIARPGLKPNQNNLQIDFVGLGFAPGEALRYEYKLEGAGGSWQPTEQRSIQLAGLSPGSYRFLVRAINSDGLTSPRPAVFSFTILPPIWRRGWFFALSALAVALAVYGLYRYRLAQAVKLERVRTRIATDLHDDIGSNLSRMAILSEAVKQQTSDRSPESAPLLADIADSARQLVDAMSDIVWSIDPRQDDAGHLTMRLRQFAADMFDPHGIRWELQTPPELEHLKLTPEQRRQVFLISKEAIHNIVKHAEATAVTMAMGATERALWLEVQDDGRGFAATETPAAAPAKRRGHGLASMKARAAQLGGALAIESRPDHGTRLRLQVPL